MAEGYNRREFSNIMAAGAASLVSGLTDLGGLVDSKEAQADPPFHIHTHTLYGNHIYFGRHHNHQGQLGNHHQNQFGFYSNPHGHNSISHQGLLVQDAALWTMFWGKAIADRAREENRIRGLQRQGQSTNYRNARDCRIQIQRPEEKPQTFLANCYHDKLNNDPVGGRKKMRFPEEYVGIGSTEFGDREKLMLGARLPLRGIKGKTFGTRLFYTDLNYRKVPMSDMNTRIVPKDFSVMYRNYDVADIARRFGYGDFEAEFWFGDSPESLKHWNTHKFKVIIQPDENAPKLPRGGVLADPIDAFNRRPKNGPRIPAGDIRE